MRRKEALKKEGLLQLEELLDRSGMEYQVYNGNELARYEVGESS